MSAEKKMERTSVGIWRVFAVVVAVALAANAVQAMAGKANFAWWHLPTLMISYKMGACGDWPPEAVSRRKAYNDAMAWLFTEEENPDLWMLKGSTTRDSDGHYLH